MIAIVYTGTTAVLQMNIGAHVFRSLPVVLLPLACESSDKDGSTSSWMVGTEAKRPERHTETERDWSGVKIHTSTAKEKRQEKAQSIKLALSQCFS